MSHKLVAGVDTSTQSTKVELRDVQTGEVAGFGSASHPPAAPPRSEQDPQAWWGAFVSAFRAATADAVNRSGNALQDVSVVAISVAGQCHGLVALDAQNEVIRPAKLWNDTTSTPELAVLKQQIGRDNLIRATGSLPTAAFTLSKVAWLARHEPENFARLRRILLPHDYLTFRLTGEFATDRSEASGTAYYNAAEGRYLTEYLELIDERRDWLSMLPEVLGPQDVAGKLTPAAAQALGIEPGIPVAPGGGDQHASALGLGIEPGDTVYSFGTSGVVFTVSEEPVYDTEGLVNGVADMTGGFLPLICTLNAAKVTDTFARLLGVDHAELSRLALSAAGEEVGPVLAAFLDGERTPDRPSATGLLANLTADTSREALARSTFEGVVMGLVTGHRHIEACGIDTSGTILAVGGGARSKAYTQTLANLLGRPVFVPDSEQATARGAAVQAAAVALAEPVTKVRSEWKPRTELAAEPQNERSLFQDAYARVASHAGFDAAFTRAPGGPE